MTRWPVVVTCCIGVAFAVSIWFFVSAALFGDAVVSVAEYDDFVAELDSVSVFSISVSSRHPRPSPVYVRVGQTLPKRISDMTEADAILWLGDCEEGDGRSTLPNGMVFYQKGHLSSITFVNGVFHSAKLSPYPEIEVGANPGGPFTTIPMGVDKMREIFGTKFVYCKFPNRRP